MNTVIKRAVQGTLAGILIAGGLVAGLPAATAAAATATTAERGASISSEWIFHSFWRTYNGCHMAGHDLLMNGTASEYSCTPATGEYSYALWYKAR